MYRHERGNALRITAVFTDPDTGELVDPDTASCIVESPDRRENFTGAMEQVSTGTYRVEVATTFSSCLGYWYVKIYGTYDGKQISNTEKFRMLEVA